MKANPSRVMNILDSLISSMMAVNISPVPVICTVTPAGSSLHAISLRIPSMNDF